MTWLWVALFACNGGGDGDSDGTPSDPGDPCAAGPNPTLVIGTGEQAFEPMSDEVELVHGPQGGYHVVISFEATYLDGESVIGGNVEGTIGGAVVATSEPWLELRCNPDTNTLQAWGTLLIYSDGQPTSLTPEEIDNQETDITTTLTDASGNQATGTVRTLIIDPLVE